MKITIVQGAFLPVPPLMGGGVEKVWYALGKEFFQRGHTVTHLSRTHADLPQSETLHGVQHVRLRGFDTPGSLTVLKALDLVYSLRVLKVLRTQPRADVLITNTFWLPMFLNSRLQRKFGRAYVHVARYPKGQMRFYRQAARLHTVSSPIARAVTQEVPDLAARVRVIPNPLPHPIPDTLPARGAGDDAAQFLYVGRVHEEKGIGLLIEAFGRLYDQYAGEMPLRLRIVGPWQTEYGGSGEKYLESLKAVSSAIGQRGEASPVEWTGPVFGSDALAEHYRRSQVFVYPSLAERGESFGLAPLEAMAFGCPPIVSGLECFQDFVTHAENGLIFDHRAATGDPVARLAEMMGRLMKDRNARNGMRVQGFDTARRFSASNVAERFLADFEEVCAA
jgi:glycosyltransferase involved in cell wall biosynthesis